MSKIIESQEFDELLIAETAELREARNLSIVQMKSDTVPMNAISMTDGIMDVDICLDWHDWEAYVYFCPHGVFSDKDCTHLTNLARQANAPKQEIRDSWVGIRKRTLECARDCLSKLIPLVDRYFDDAKEFVRHRPPSDS